MSQKSSVMQLPQFVPKALMSDRQPPNTAYRITLSGLVLLRPGGLILLPPLTMDAEIEIALRQGTRPTGFDRLNTLWWIVALLRLSSGAPLKLPVVSDVSFSVIADGSIEPSLWRSRRSRGIPYGVQSPTDH